MKKIPQLFLVFPGLFISLSAQAQMITGVWKGRINKQRAELKLIQQGDSLTGSVYYYQSAHVYRRYSIKGYFDPLSNEVVWWDDRLVEEKTGRFNFGLPGKNGFFSRADFNCPGEGKMMLEGKASKKDDAESGGEVHLNKANGPTFPDEWDLVIENYLAGGNDPDLIDSIRSAVPPGPVTEPLAGTEPQEKVELSPVIVKPPGKEENKQQDLPGLKPPVVPGIREKFHTRKQVLVKEIPLLGDSIELRFYDNAEIDGDSISLFLNDHLVFEHIRLTGRAYTIRLAVAELKESNDLVMVAENLGAIPPNTSYMVAIVAGERYEARLESSEGSSAMIRLVKR